MIVSRFKTRIFGGTFFGPLFLVILCQVSDYTRFFWDWIIIMCGWIICDLFINFEVNSWLKNRMKIYK